MKRRNPRIEFEVEGHRWSMIVDRNTGHCTMRQHGKRMTYQITPTRLVELAVGQKVMPFAEKVERRPERHQTDWEKAANLAVSIAGLSYLQTSGHIPQPVQYTFA